MRGVCPNGASSAWVCTRSKQAVLRHHSHMWCWCLPKLNSQHFISLKQRPVPWSKGLYLLPSLFFTTRGRIQWINAAFSCLLRQEPVGIWILLQHQQHRHVGSCQDTASLRAPLCWKPQEISATLLPSKSCMSHGQCCSTGRVPSACHSARTGVMGHGRGKRSV